MAPRPTDAARRAESLARCELWKLIASLAADAQRREEQHRATLGAETEPPSVEALLATLATGPGAAQMVARAVEPALRRLFDGPSAPTQRTRRERILMLLAVRGPLHAQQVALHLEVDLPSTLYVLSDLLRDAGELEHPSDGLWGLSADGWRAVRAVSTGSERG